MKEQHKVIARDLNETDMSNMANGEFKATNIRTLSGLGKRTEEFRETLKTEMKEIKNQK